MSLRSRRVEHPTLTLELPQLDRYHDRAERALSKTVTAYGAPPQDVNQAQWKCLRSLDGVRLLRGRQLAASGQIPLLCIGALRGSFDDIMEGIYCQSTEEMLLMNAIKCPRVSESAVLYSVQRQTVCEPYVFTGVKWTTIKTSVASNRDFCYFDKMGLVRQTSGKRMAYHIMQSVELPEYPHTAAHKRMEASLCYIFEELETNVVGVYMQGEIENTALSYFATSAVLDLLLAFTNALECTRAKKLAEMMVVAPPGRWKRRVSRKFCDVCRSNRSFFDTLHECASCHLQYVCKKCRVLENVFARDTTVNAQMLRAEFCRICIAKTDTMSIEDLRAETCGFSVSGLRAADTTKEPEDVDIPGSVRSLTAFTLNITARLQDLGTCSDHHPSTFLSTEQVSMSDDEDELLGEGQDVLNSIGKKSKQLMPLDKESTDTSRFSSRSTTSTTSSSLYQEENDSEQYRMSLFARLLQVSNQAEATYHFTQKQSLVANSVLQRNR
ncbi:hypothetical protein CCR75_004394 [Bremia lactucae]|uniref:FYVE-type domain-containing protein n=1 Tax=Bremia lactucae TaxID=4779 RepID=A0A976FMB3_BRELC|nr:hypothetical protein CCR75_004394 [Bremia lactucae]